jgi:hypothetical protein
VTSAGAWPVEPLRVLDDANKRLLLGHLGEQRQRGKADQEPAGGSTDGEPEHAGEGVALRDGKPIEVIQHGCAKLMEAAVGEFHLRLDAHGPRDAPAGDAVGEVVQQRTLTHARLAPQHCDSTPACERVGQEPVQRLALDTPSEESGGSRASLSDQGRAADVSNWSVASPTRRPRSCGSSIVVDHPASYATFRRSHSRPDRTSWVTARVVSPGDGIRRLPKERGQGLTRASHWCEAAG